jgi:hypothetical protein
MGGSLVPRTSGADAVSIRTFAFERAENSSERPNRDTGALAGVS